MLQHKNIALCFYERGDTIYVHIMVAQTGLEPVRLSATDFKSVVSAYSTTGPYNAVFRSRNSTHLSLKSSNRLVES